ncbi:hypothetical protein KGF54_004315 [Candida jiufengensis]|uniref:uncharacterized protein n=1 Tax=Candida jiufengensis TaxID=497108 RepID=UPI00222546E6|nr:uncharacterized protein KGF54_004315 [Candida jiufengensis]KAI5951241.1 hypothetical protein KGF54_004315 [Candida jiufengensis]
MRSLPPPRITRARRWKRIRRALKNLLTKGYISDFGVFHQRTLYSRHFYSISKIHKSAILNRMKTRKTDFNLVQTAHSGVRIMRFFSGILTRFSVPGLKEDLVGFRKGKMNLCIKV